MRLLFFLGSVFFFLNSAFAGERSPDAGKNTIYWLFYELPGAVNFSDEKEGPGYIVEIFNVLKAKMPEYTHQVVEMPFLRGLQQMKKKKSVCSLMFLKNPERERFMNFGTPYIAGMPAGVIASKENKKVQKYVANEKTIDVDKMLTDRSVQVGVVVQRFYGKKISSSLVKHPEANILQKQGSLVDRELRNLLKLGRIDVYFGYPFEIEGYDKAEFYFVKGNTELLEPRIGCEKTGFGEAVIAKTEEVRAKYGLDKEFNTIHERFYSKNMKEKFAKMSKGL